VSPVHTGFPVVITIVWCSMTIVTGSTRRWFCYFQSYLQKLFLQPTIFSR